MKYIERTLLAGEKISYRAKIHWWTFVAPSITLLIGLCMIPAKSLFIVVLGYILLLVGAYGIINRGIERACSDFVVTNKRVIFKTGLIRRNIVDLQLSKAEAIAFKESLLGRVLNFGSLIVTTGGASNIYPWIHDPLSFRKAISEEIDRYAGKSTDA